jgi:hypothetical protein
MQRGLFDAAVRGDAIRLTCWKCGHVRVLDARGLWWLFHRNAWPELLSEVQRRTVCVPCRDQAGVIIRNPELVLVHEPPTGDALPLPPAQEWRRALRRRN